MGRKQLASEIKMTVLSLFVCLFELDDIKWVIENAQILLKPFQQ